MNLRSLTGTFFDALAEVPSPMRKAVIVTANAFRKRRITKLKTPLWLTMYVTDGCNAKCDHCFYWQELNSKRYQITVSDIEKIVRSLKHRLYTVGLTGGEPFLRKDLADVYEVFDAHRATGKIQISTHGGQVETTKKFLESVVKRTRHHTMVGMSVSLDGLKETHDRIRRWPGLFDKTVETIRFVREMSRKYSFLSVGVCTSISHQNAAEIPALMDFVARDLDAPHGLDFVRSTTTDAFGLDPDVVMNYGPPAEGLAGLNGLEVDRIEEQIRARRKNSFRERMEVLRMKDARKIRDTHQRVFPCVAGMVDGVIYASGDVSFCEFTKPFGNLRPYDFDLYKLWHSPEAEERRPRIQSCACTHPVNLIRSLSYDTNSLLRLADPDFIRTAERPGGNRSRYDEALPGAAR